MSFDAGSQPLAYLPDAVLDAGVVTAGPGTVALNIELLGSPLSLTISNARIEATVDAGASGLDATGIAMTDGKLGGVVRTDDVFRAVNSVAAGCECLGLAGDLIDISSGSPVCDPEANVEACGTAGETTCEGLGSNCSLLTIVGGIADIDTDGDEEPDAISLGATLTTVGASITGLTAE